ncbi:MAG: hypothetical protein ACTSYS_14070 [Promethearchaeota archaeon]
MSKKNDKKESIFFNIKRRENVSNHRVFIRYKIAPGKFLKKIMPDFIEIVKKIEIPKETESPEHLYDELWVLCPFCHSTEIKVVFFEDIVTDCEETQVIDPTIPSVCRHRITIKPKTWCPICKHYNGDYLTPCETAECIPANRLLPFYCDHFESIFKEDD